MPRTTLGATYWTREEWGARHPSGLRMPEGVAKRLVVVHHSWRPDVPCGLTKALERQHVRGMESYHHGKWGQGIAYDFLVFQSGRVYEGKGWGWVGTHTAGQNTAGLGVCFVINGDSRAPTDAAWEAAQEILDASVRAGYLVTDYQVHGHRDFSPKSCPGDLVYPLLRDKLAPDGSRALPLLRIGARGQFVRLLQERMGLPVDGVFGPLTEAAVREAQQEAGALADGIVGPTTWAILGVS